MNRRRIGGRATKDQMRQGRNLLAALRKRRSGAEFTDSEYKRRMNMMVGRRQGYKDREDESLGMRRGPERDFQQSDRDRRDESYGRRGTRDARRRRGER